MFKADLRFVQYKQFLNVSTLHIYLKDKNSSFLVPHRVVEKERTDLVWWEGDQSAFQTNLDSLVRNKAIYKYWVKWNLLYKIFSRSQRFTILVDVNIIPRHIARIIFSHHEWVFGYMMKNLEEKIAFHNFYVKLI